MRAEFDYRDGAARERRGFGVKAGLAASALLLTGSLIGWSASAIGAGGGTGISPAPATSAPVAAPAAAAGRVIGAGGDSYASLVDEVAPAVVTVRSERRVRAVSSDVPDDPLFRQFFGDRSGREPAAGAAGRRPRLGRDRSSRRPHPHQQPRRRRRRPRQGRSDRRPRPSTRRSSALTRRAISRC